MSVKSPARINLHLGVSPALAVVLLLAYGGALVIAMLIPLHLWLRVLLAAAIGAGFYDATARHVLRRTRRAVVALSLNEEDGGCAVRRYGSDGWEEGRLIDRWVHPRLTLLVMRCDGRRWPLSVVIPADAVAPEPFRRLRVRLRLPAAEE